MTHIYYICTKNIEFIQRLQLETEPVFDDQELVEGKLFTANRDLMAREVAMLETKRFSQIIEKIVNILRTSLSER